MNKFFNFKMQGFPTREEEAKITKERLKKETLLKFLKQVHIDWEYIEKKYTEEEIKKMQEDIRAMKDVINEIIKKI